MKKKQFIASILLAMKIIVVQFTIAVTFAFSVYAKKTEAQGILDKPVTLSVDKITVFRFISLMQQQTGVKFLYSPSAIDGNQKISYSGDNKKISEALCEVMKPLDIRYKVVDDQILLYPDETSLNPLPDNKAVNIASDHYVGGTVVNEKGEPQAGVSVTIKGTSLGVSTNDKGYFRISVKDENAVLLISYIGYKTQEIKVGNKTDFVLKLEASTDQLNDIVVVGYGSQKKKDLTGSVAVVNVTDAKKNPSYDVAKMLQGQVAGVTVHGSGEPGGYVQLKIRGISNFGDNSPLFVIDGVPIDAPFDFSPDDIESISILKDASAGAIYGSRAATGVVIITTKKGKAGIPKISLNGYYGVQKVPKKISVLDRVGYQKVVNAATTNAGLSLVPANDPSNPNFISKINTDWQDAALKTGSIQDYNVGISGGSEAISYNVSMGFFDQTGYQVGPQAYKRYSLNSGLQGKKGKLSYGVKLAYMYSKKGNYSGTANHAVFGGTVTSMLTAIPTMPVYDSTKEGGYGGTDQTIHRAISANVVGLNSIVDDWSERNRVLLNGWAELEIARGLKYKINASFDRTDWKNYHYEPSFNMGFYYINTQYYYMEAFGQPNKKLVENTLSYNFSRDKHNLDLLAGYTFERGNDYSQTGTSRADGNLAFPSFSNAAASANTITEYKGTYVTTGIIGKATYNYDSRYMLNFNFRRDGSSKFAPAKRYGNFTGVSAGWNVLNEKFVDLHSIFSSLKVRGGWGTLGNQLNLGAYEWQSYINNASNYNFSNTYAHGATTVSVTDPNLHWESATTSDVAVDMGFLKEKLTVTLEYYNKTASDILTLLPQPYSLGSVPNTMRTNAASVKNSGIEATVGYRKTEGKFTFNVNANFATYKNKVLKLGGTNNPIYGSGSKTEVGRSVGELFGYQTEGLFQTAEQVAGHAFQSVQTAPGDVIFRAQNGKNNDHTYTLTDANDRVYLGNTTPTYGFGVNFNANYGDFDFSFFIQGSGGNKVFNGVYQALMTGQYGNQSTDELNFWTPTNKNTNVPRPIINDPNGNNRFSNLFVESGNYAKLQNVQLGYNLPATSSIVKAHIVNRLRIYIAGENVFTMSKYKGYDPDFISDGLFNRGFDYGSFPNARTFMFGIQAGF
ncbi:TonB-dependent receptor [Pinibacter soli]|uniref:TonB-dependent receptor n=1 Tax=Pinibacter soli TaxID=3044211 RepID=A0ABT6RHL0_9BACT|nr:TonB-dependent receptor [Pinibacter soli]MDI3321961.1 TonB-dependent receptor [Pinibacter soli]